MLQIQKINFNNVTFKGTSSIKNEDMTPSQLQSKETALTSSLNCLSALGQSCICKNCTKYTPFQELYIKNGVAYDKQGLLFTGETQIQKDESETILSYENGILKKSTHTISNAKLKEETIKEYNGNSNDIVVSSSYSTISTLAVEPSFNSANCVSVVVIDNNFPFPLSSVVIFFW